MAKESKKPRRFSDEFKVGDQVRIIRHRHGWEDGRIAGVVKWIGAHECHVGELCDHGVVSDGCYEIEHPRDIYKDRG